MTEFIALLFGAGVISVFAYRRFNIATFQTQENLQRLGDLLLPNQMRARDTVRLSFLLYLVLLLTAYLAICLYARVLPKGFGSTFGDVGAQSLPGMPELGDGGAFLPLSIALVFVGLGPSVPGLIRVEEWLREKSHWIVGIPTRVLGNADRLKTSEAERLADVDNDPILREEDRKTLAFIASSEFSGLLTPLRLIAAVSAWVLEDRVALLHPEARRPLRALEKRLLDRKTELFRSLRRLNGLGPVPPSGPAPSDPHAPGGAPAVAQTTLETETRNLADDMRIYLAMLAEHGVLPRSPKRDGSASQRAGSSLLDYLNDILEPEQVLAPETVVTGTVSWAFWIVLAGGVLWGATLAAVEERLAYPFQADLWTTSIYARAIPVSVTLLLAYLLPLIIALSLWFTRVEPRLGSAGTAADAGGHWTEAVPRIAMGMLVGWITACMAISALAMIRSLIAEQPLPQGKGLVDMWVGLMEYNAPISLRGAIFAAIVVQVVQRAYRAANGSGQLDNPVRVALLGALVMAVVGAATRTFMILVGIAKTPGSGWLPTDSGGVFWSALQCGLLAGIVLLAVTASLNQKIRSSPHHVPKPDTPGTSDGKGIGAVPGQAAS